MDVKSKLVEALRSLDTLMVATRAPNGSMHARPMAVAEVDDDGAVWFATARDSGKTDEAVIDNHALATGQTKVLFVSLSGELDVIADRERIQQLWKESWKVWFPEGQDDPNLVLMRLRPTAGEYWDERGSKGIAYLFEAARAFVQGERPEDLGPKHHAKVPLVAGT